MIPDSKTEVKMETDFGIDVGVLVDKLNSFETPLEIADFLRSQDVQGGKADATSCVISNWIIRESGARRVSTSSDIKVWEFGTRASTEDVEKIHKVSAVVTDFITMFDGGEYPDLVYMPLFDDRGYPG